ncbi:hypothetical protein SRABI13_01488 [Erwinia aphidicola]|nr:hypothetical protein SRABI13_01488 [Erwinia aphidicola]
MTESELISQKILLALQKIKSQLIENTLKPLVMWYWIFQETWVI